MYIYHHKHQSSSGVLIAESISLFQTPTFENVAANDSVTSQEIFFDNKDVLKMMWNPAAQAVLAIVDALPKIQVISTAGIIQ